MKKQALWKTVFCVMLALGVSFLFAEENEKKNKIMVEITDVKTDTGKILLSVYDSEKNYKKQVPYHTAKMDAAIGTMYYECELPDGEYIFAICHDLNDNEEMDTGFMGIPKEPFAMSNYDGTGFPGKYDKHKVVINSDKTVPMPLFTFKEANKKN